MNLAFPRPFVAGCCLVALASSARAQYANSVEAYTPGTGATAGYTNPTSALGEPSRVTPGNFGGPVDPFNAPYLDSQIVSLGAGGSLTVRFATPISNDPINPFGLDFQVFGGAGFVITNAFDQNFNYIGTPATDGSLYGAQTGSTRVSVSVDGVNYFVLDPTVAPKVEDLYPTDGQGNFGTPVDPSLKYDNFAGKTLAEIRALYGGSGGGVGFDLGWAKDAQGNLVNLANINYIRVEVLGGKAEIDGFSVVRPVPEPGTWALLGLGLGSLIVVGVRRRNGK